MAESNSRPPAKQGLIGKWFSRITTVFFWLLISLLFSIGSEWIGMHFTWPEEGVNHSKHMLETEIEYLNKDFKKSLLVSTPVIFASEFASDSYKWMFVKTGIESFIVNKRKNSKVNSSLTTVEKYVLSAMYVTQVFSVRLAIMFLALPVFFIFAAVASVEGLVQRDIRKWEMGREHSGLYHYAKRSVPFFFVAPWVVYLSIPFSVHPNAVILPFAVIFAIGVFMTTYLFKKYI